jgi:hypothetical protein
MSRWICMGISNAQNNVYQVLRNIFERNVGYHKRIYRQRSRSWTVFLIRIVLFSSNRPSMAFTASLLVLALHIRCRDGYMSVSNAQNNVYQLLRSIFERNVGYHERIYRQRSRSWTVLLIRIVLFSSNCLTVAITASLLVLALHIRCRDGYMSVSNAQNNVYQVLRNIFERNAGYHERIYRQRSRSWTMFLIRIVLFSSNRPSMAFTASLLVLVLHIRCRDGFVWAYLMLRIMFTKYFGTSLSATQGITNVYTARDRDLGPCQ